MKKIFAILIIILVSQASPGQNSFSQQFVGSGGGVNHNSSYLVHWSVGDLVTATVPLAPGSVTQGFQQPQILHPEVQALLVNFTDPFSDHFTANWTNGSGVARVVFVKQTSSGTTTPVNNHTYSADPYFGHGEEIGTGWFCVYNGTGSSVTITHVAAGLPYTVQVFEYNGGAGSEQYTMFPYIDNPNNWSFTCNNPANGGVIAANQTICVNTAAAPFTNVSLPPTPYDGTLEYQWRISTNGSAFSDISGATGTDYTYSGLINVPTWFRRMAKVTCESNWVSSNVLEINLEQPSLSGSLAKTPNQAAVCQGAPVSASLTAGSGGNGTDETQYRTETGVSWSSWASYSSGSTIATAGLSGVEVRTRRLADYCSSSSYTTVSWTLNACTDIIWTGAFTTDWNTPGNWNENIVPTATISAMIPNGSIPNNPTVNEAPATPAQCLHLTVQADRILTVATGKALTVHGNTINNGTSLSLIVENQGSLITLGTVTGNATVKSDIGSNEWHFISPPISNAVSGLFLNDYLQKFTESTSLFTDIIPTDVPLVPINGYALYGGASGINAVYQGPLNSGTIGSVYNLTRLNEGWNLVGNPYPSSIDCGAASGWTVTNIDAATYIHVNSTTWAEFVGGIGANGGSRYIAPCQGFFVRVSSNGNATFMMDNDVRVHHTTTFFKDAVTDFIRLEVTGNNVKDEAVVRLLSGSTEAFDNEFDADKMFADDTLAPQLYSMGGDMLAINAIPEAKPVIVGLRTAQTGTYTIKATEINNLTDVSLEDTKNNTFTDLTKDVCTFNFQAGENEQRFILHFKALGIPGINPSSINIYGYNKTIYVDLKEEMKGDVFVYDISGRLVVKATAEKGMNKVNLQSEGIYIVKVISGGKVMVKKIIL